MSLASARQFISADRAIDTHMEERYETHGSNAPALKTLGVYYVKETNLRRMLWSLNVPVMLMLGFYLYMVANLIAERQRTEIAVLRSRGRAGARLFSAMRWKDWCWAPSLSYSGLIWGRH
ncbi:hypothetical protein LJK88_17275 [Paenibacillus sp. P26]|nr:hypothetical protein LJK88_17275 [Paenibacillus sp. P26]